MANTDQGQEAVNSIPAGSDTFDPSNIPTGFAATSPEAKGAINDLLKSRGSVRFGVQTAIAAGGAGAQAAQAAQGPTNPVSAFMQGAAAGLQIPSILYQQKKDQLKSTLDASPLSAVMPDLAERYPVLASIPTALAIKTIQNIAVDSNTLIQQHNAKVGVGPGGPDVMNPIAEDAPAIINEDTSPVIVAAVNKLNPGSKMEPYDLVGQKTADWKGYLDTVAEDVKAARSATAIKAKDDALLMQIRRTTDPSVAMRGSALGMVGQNNIRAKRALALLDRPSGELTPQEKNSITTDIAAIMKGGVPDVGGEAANSYKTYLDSASEAWRKISGDQTALDQPQIREALLRTLKDIVTVDNNVISSNLDKAEALHSDLISRNQDAWDSYKQKVLSDNVYAPAPALPRKTIGGKTYEKFGPNPSDWREAI